jgi:hypothetical protein
LELKTNTERDWQLVTNKLEIINQVLADEKQIAYDAIQMGAPTFIVNLFKTYLELSPQSKEVRERLPSFIIHAFRIFVYST